MLFLPPDHYYVKISVETTEVLWETAGRDPPQYGCSVPDSQVQVPESAALRESINTAVGDLTALRLLVAFLNRIDSARLALPVSAAVAIPSPGFRTGSVLRFSFSSSAAVAAVFFCQNSAGALSLSLPERVTN